MTSVLIKRGNLGTKTEMLGECHVMTGVMLSQANRGQRFLANHQKLGGMEQIFLSWPSEGTYPANTLVLAF